MPHTPAAFLFLFLINTSGFKPPSAGRIKQSPAKLRNKMQENNRCFVAAYFYVMAYSAYISTAGRPLFGSGVLNELGDTR